MVWLLYWTIFGSLLQVAYATCTPVRQTYTCRHSLNTESLVLIAVKSVDEWRQARRRETKRQVVGSRRRDSTRTKRMTREREEEGMVGSDRAYLPSKLIENLRDA